MRLALRRYAISRMLLLTIIFLCSLILRPSSLGDLFFGPRFCGHAYDGCAKGKRALLTHTNDMEMLLTRSFLEVTLRGVSCSREHAEGCSSVLSESIPLL